jgi:hypothetical protein
MEPQRVVADERIKADAGTTALKYGPLVYNVETHDNRDINKGLSQEPLEMQWRPDLLGGVMVMTGKWNDGSPMMAIPNYARMNRVGPPRDYPEGEGVDYAPGATPGATPGAGTKALGISAKADHPAKLAAATATGGEGDVTPADRRRSKKAPAIESKVWI